MKYDYINISSIKIELMLSDRDGVPRLGVPPFGHNECIHGAHNDGENLTTLFPQVISYARR